MRSFSCMLGRVLIASCLVATPVMAKAVESSLAERIIQAQKHLGITERRIAKQRQVAANQLADLERKVSILREKTAVARRLADEKTVSLSKLEARRDSWREQQVFQQNLLHRFLQQHGQDDAGLTQQPTRIAQAMIVATDIERRFYPSWRSADIVLPSGEVSSLPVLAVGPVTWFWETNEKRAGLASLHDGEQNLLHADLLLSGGDSQIIARLHERVQGEIIFDPTLTRALARQQNTESILEHVSKGGLWVVPILLFAIFALGICLFKACQLWRLPKLQRLSANNLNIVLDDTESPLYGKIKGMQKVLLEIARDNRSPKQRDDQLFVQLQDDKYRLDRWIGAVAITAAVSPLLGLLGTVSGMIETFKMMTLFGSGDPEVVSGGIAQALVTTELGLVVAIPALILNAILSRRAKFYYAELEGFAILLSKSDETASLAP